MTDLITQAIKSVIRTKRKAKSSKRRVYVVLTPNIADFMQSTFNVSRRVDLASIFVLLTVLRKHNLINMKQKLSEDIKNEIAELTAELSSKDED